MIIQTVIHLFFAENDIIMIHKYLLHMIAISYTITPFVQEDITLIDRYHKHILLTPISPDVENKLRWLATNEHILGTFNLTGASMTDKELRNILMHPSKRPSANERFVYAYKDALTVIRTDWTAAQKPLKVSHVGALGLIAHPWKARDIMRTIREIEPDIKHLLSYIASQKDHPIILAGVLYGQLMRTELGTVSQGTIPRLLTLLILAKYGYDCRGMLALEPRWVQATENHQKALESITHYGNLTLWLEHFTKTARTSFETLYTRMQTHTDVFMTDAPASAWLLNSREERILQQLDNPAVKITNRDIQREFHISQVTASRDLRHLTALGLLYAHGKGRSVYYTKA